MSVCLSVCLSVCMCVSMCVCVRVSVVDCGDRAADWLRSVVNIENIRLVGHQFTDDINSQQSSDRLISDGMPNTAHS